MSGAELLIAGTAIGAYGAISSASSRSDAMEKQALLRREQAYQAQLAAEREARITERQGDRFMSIQKAAIGQSGTQLSGSNLLMLEETAANIKENIQAIRQAGEYRSYVYGKESSFDQANAAAERRAGLFNLGSVLISGASKNPYAYDAPRKKQPYSIGFTGDSYELPASRTYDGTIA